MDVCYISIPGDKLQISAQRVDDNIKRRFPREWLAYTQGDIMPVNGTPLSQLPTLSQGEALKMQATGIMTIEDLAGISDGAAKSIMGGIGWRKKAEAYLAHRKPDETAELKQELSDLKTQMAELMAKLNGTEPKRGPGRPPNTDKAA